MFSFGAGLLAGQHDCKKERPPPSRPIPVTFPSLTPLEPSLRYPPTAWTGDSLAGIPAHFVSLNKPSDVNEETLALLNVSFGSLCEFETLVPYSSDGAPPFLPPSSWLEAPDQTDSETPLSQETSAGLLSNGRKAPDRKDFYVRSRELLFEKEDAFAALTRKPSPGQQPPRLAYFRKFWEGLDNLAYYWDDSLDEYLPPKEEASSSSEARQEPTLALSNEVDDNGATGGAGSTSGSGSESPDVEEPRKKAKTGEVNNGSTTLSINSQGFGSSTASTQSRSITSSKGLPARAAPPKVPWAENMQSSPERAADLSRGSYRGYRIGNGSEMPDQYRLDCVRAFLEPIAWAFGITFAPHRRPPVVCLEHVRFPVRMNSVGWRGPTDRLKARAGWLEGPLLGIQCRPETSFGSSGNLKADSVLDVVRELGGMLLLAQERAREGKIETRAGEGKWWTSKPRWGGGPGGEVGEAAGASDTPPQDTAPNVEEKPPGWSKLGSKDRRRPSPAELWKVLKAGNPLWDPKVKYEAIGKDRSSDWDEIFMVSSLNHHISVLKLRVHRLYMQYLTEGTLPEKEPVDRSWFLPSLQRTRWYDLFSIEDRTEAMRGLWGIIAYLMRPREDQKTDVTVKEV